MMTGFMVILEIDPPYLVTLRTCLPSPPPRQQQVHSYDAGTAVRYRETRDLRPRCAAGGTNAHLATGASYLAACKSIHADKAWQIELVREMKCAYARRDVTGLRLTLKTR